MIRAGILPAGSDPIVTTLEKGEHRVVIVKNYDNNELRAKYPDGFERDHQAATPQELAPKIVNNFRARYGAEAVTITKLPSDLTEGATFLVEI